MADSDWPPLKGQIITYCQGDPEAVVYGRAVSTGAVIVDPCTGSRWLPVILVDLRRTLVSAAQVVHF